MKARRLRESRAALMNTNQDEALKQRKPKLYDQSNPWPVTFLPSNAQAIDRVVAANLDFVPPYGPSADNFENLCCAWPSRCQHIRDFCFGLP